MEATLPRTGGVYSPPAGTKGVSNTTIQSVPYNAFVDDLTADANAARPITAGGTGATSASGARTALGLGTAAVKNTGTSGNTVPLLDGANTWSAVQTFASTPKIEASDPRLTFTDTDTGVSGQISAQSAQGSLYVLVDNNSLGSSPVFGVMVRGVEKALFGINTATLKTDVAFDADKAISFAGTGAATTRANLGVAIGTNVQAYDAGLQSIAGLTTAADRMIYTTASDVYATTALTPFARTILDDADAASVRATLGLVIGTNVQAQDPELQAIAGLTSAADRLPYFTGSGTASLATFTSYGRSLVDDADASAARATLGLGTAATFDTGTSGTTIPFLSGTNTWSGVNTFTGGNPIRISSAQPGILFTDTDTGANCQITANSSLGAMTIAADLDNTVSGSVIFFAIDGTNVATLTAAGNLSLTGTVGIGSGGTGAADAATARTNLGLGGLATQSIGDLVYTGSTSTLTNYPVGTELFVMRENAPFIERNWTGNVYYRGADASSFSRSSSGNTLLSGTWACRGSNADNAGFLLMERIA